MSETEIRACKDKNPKTVTKEMTLAGHKLELRLCESCSKDPLYQ